MVAVIATTAAHKDLVDSSPASPRAPTTTTMTLEQTFGFLQFLLFFLFFSLSSLPPRVPVFACRPTATGLSPQFPPPIVHLKSQTYAHNYNYDRSFQQRGANATTSTSANWATILLLLLLLLITMEVEAARYSSVLTSCPIRDRPRSAACAANLMRLPSPPPLFPGSSSPGYDSARCPWNSNVMWLPEVT